MTVKAKRFRIGVEGATTDGREIQREWLEQMAASYNPAVYTALINLEHIKSYLPDSTFNRYGKVTALFAEEITEGPLAGKMALYADVEPTESLVELVKKGQKLFTSMEVSPKFADTGKAYLVGLAATDDPASLGTEMLTFSASAAHNPLANRKQNPANLFTAAEETVIELEEVQDDKPSLFARVTALFTKKEQSAAFLTLINVTPVTEQSGQLLGLGVGSTIAGTTDTTAKEREPVDPTLMVDVEYKCEQTNFDTVLTYAKLDLWAKFQDFQVRIRDAIVKRQALDRIMIGFNGVKRAKTSNRSENPLLQDVNKGWLQKIREDAPDHVMGSTTTGGETTPGAVKVGKGGEYANLDAVVMDAVNELIDVVYQDDDDLVVICGRELLSDKYFPLVNKEQENSEKLAADMIISQKRMGGLQAVRAPFFPPNALLITRLDNLSIYWQEDTRRRSVIDNPKRDRIENFESVNEAYVVEDYRCAALVENIQIGDFSAAAAEAGA
ncbi:TPA: phage major capsid protein, P2 family [Escherichia coli]|nr:phage major capsid protein, P2 family [Escherichia coli]